MIEIQCSSCHTRYRIDERVLPEDTPTFKCSRCGHVFSAEPRRRKAVSGNQPVAPAERIEKLRQSPPEPAPVLPMSPPVPVASPPPLADPAPRRADVPPPPSVELQRTAVAPVAAAERPISKPAPTSGELMARNFTEPEEDQAKPDENLSFDFNDEAPEPASLSVVQTPSADEWKVGDNNPDFESPPSPGRLAQPLQPRAEADFARRRSAVAADDDADETPDEAAFEILSGRVHSSGFFIGLILLVIVSFGLITTLICNAPASGATALSRLPGIGASFAPPIGPAREIALRNVQAAYRSIKGNLPTLIVTGTAENVGRVPLHTIQLTLQVLVASRRPLATVAVFCGNNLAAKMLGEMTAREIDFYQKLQPPKNFVLQPLAPADFTVVFLRPPATVSDVSIEVTQAEAATADEVAQAASPN